LRKRDAVKTRAEHLSWSCVGEDAKVVCLCGLRIHIILEYGRRSKKRTVEVGSDRKLVETAEYVSVECGCPVMHVKRVASPS
jgi:hypothetical protein